MTSLFDDAAEAARALPRPHVAIGNFDGVHRGHRSVLERARVLAEAARAPLLVMTFRPHPAVVLGGTAPPRLATDAQQEELLAECGVDGLLRLRFDAALAAATPEEFHDRVLRGLLRASGVVVGVNFRFGAGRRGDVALLQRLVSAPGSGMRVEALPALQVGGEAVSSTRIRSLVAGGRMDQAEALLGRPFAIEGRVVRGEGRGRQLGFPTANVEPGDVMVPAIGIYACVLRAGDSLVGAATSVGRRPTFGGGEVVVEAHALDFAGDLYGRVVRLSFLERLRDELAFDSAEALVARVREDVAATRNVLSRTPPESLAGIAGT